MSVVWYRMTEGRTCGAILAEEGASVAQITRGGGNGYFTKETGVPDDITHVYVMYGYSCEGPERFDAFGAVCELLMVKPGRVESIGFCAEDSRIPESLFGLLETTTTIRKVQCEISWRGIAESTRRIMECINRNAGITDLAAMTATVLDLVMPNITHLMVKGCWDKDDQCAQWLTVCPHLVSFEADEDDYGWRPSAADYRAIDATPTIETIRGIVLATADQCVAFCEWAKHTRVSELQILIWYEDDADITASVDLCIESVANNTAVRHLIINRQERISHPLLK